MLASIHFTEGKSAVERRETRAPLAFHQTVPGFEPTELLVCPGIADALGVHQVTVKNEAYRAGLPSFKILGASWATARAIQREWLGLPPGTDLPFPALQDAVTRWQAESGRRGTLVAATDGNHGRGVARMAALLGLSCRILVPLDMTRSRIQAIEDEGAEVRVVPGSYDDAIAESAALAGPDVLVVSDTSWEGYTETPSDVIDGYSTLYFEIDEALRDRDLPRPSHVVLQGGVGSFAAAGLRHFDPDEVVSIIVEPASANCLMESARAGERVEVKGPHTSTMVGLNCGWPSLLAWPVVQALADAFIAVEDEALPRATQLLAAEGIVAGESGAAGLAGLLSVLDGPGGDDVRRRLRLSPGSRVLLVNTEGATDPDHYAELLQAPVA